MPSGHHNGKRGPKRTHTQKKADRVFILQLLRIGWSQKRIAAKLGVDPSEINHDYRQILKDLARTQNLPVAQLRAKAIAELEQIKTEAQEAWERSKRPGKKIVTTETETERGIRTSKTTIRQGRLPQESYLKLVRDCIEDERELQALDPPKKMVVGHTIAWDDLIAVPTPVDDVEAEIQLLESNKGAHVPPEQVSTLKPRTNGEKDHK